MPAALAEAAWHSPESRCSHAGPRLRRAVARRVFKFSVGSAQRVQEAKPLSLFLRYQHRFGTVNDEGWDLGQSRFRGIDHEWGEFYQVDGDLRLDSVPGEWRTREPDTGDRLHFLFYFRDEDFECDARGWHLNVIRKSKRPSEE